MIDERDEGQSLADWFIHGSRKKKENKKVQLIDPNAAQAAEQQTQQPMKEKT